MNKILNALPFGIIIILKKEIDFINDKAKEILGLGLKGDPISIGTVMGRIGISSDELKKEQEIKIFQNIYYLNRLLVDEREIIIIYEKNFKKEEDVEYFSHEIKAPLSSIIGSIQALIDGLAGQVTENQKKFLNIALRNCQRIKEIVEDTFDYKCLEKGTDKIDFKSFGLKEFADEIIDSFLLAKKDKNIIILKNFCNEEKNYYGYGDKTKLTQVFTNILINAWNNSDEGKNIIVSLEVVDMEDKKFAKFSITNDGKELSRDLREKIFNVYYHSGKYKGLGLGLPISKKIIEKHGGEIDYFSKEGKTTFYFTFPAIEKVKKKILFVEDERDLQEILKSYLDSLGYEVKVASSGNEAIEILKSFFPDLLITDLMMPDGTGWELLKKIGSWEKKPKLIVLSGMKTILDHSIALDILKVNSFIDKPFDMKKLVEEIEILLKEK